MYIDNFIPTYTFTYTAITSFVKYITVFGAAAYVSSANQTFSDFRVLPVITGTAAITELANIHAFMLYVRYIYLLQYGGHTITTDYDIYPITAGNFYNISTSSTSNPITINFRPSSADDVFYIYNRDLDLDLSLVTFNLNGATVQNIYIFCDMNLTFSSQPMYGNFICGGSSIVNPTPVTVYGTVSIQGTLTIQNYTDTANDGYLTVQYPASTYPFTFVANATVLSYFSWEGDGLVGSPDKSTTVGVSPTPSQETDQETNLAIDNLANVNAFAKYVTTVYLHGVDFTMNIITVDYDIEPISSNQWYLIGDITSPITLTFMPTSLDDAFYIYNDTDLDLSLITFEQNGATAQNIYIICDGNITLSTQTMYGNFICGGSFYINPTPVTLYGTATAQGILGINMDATSTAYLTVQFPAPATTPCFVKGTKILTDQWYVPVEDLKVGDLVITHGEINDNKFHVIDTDTASTIINIIKCTRKASTKMSPVVITKNAFGINRPFEDLYVSNNHGVLNRNGMLWAARRYINGTTVYQNTTVDQIEYYHIEVAAHCAITANGVMVETYRPKPASHKTP